MSEELEVIRQGDEIEISVHNGVSGGWITLPIQKAGRLTQMILDIITDYRKEENTKLDAASAEIQRGIRERKGFDKTNMEGNLTAGLRDKEW